MKERKSKGDLKYKGKLIMELIPAEVLVSDQGQ